MATTVLGPIELEVITGTIRSAEVEIEAAVERAARSPMIRDQHDYRVGLYDARGRKLTGRSYGSLIEPVFEFFGDDIHPGDVFALNAPYNGGTHLPDITVVTPVFGDAGKEILFWVAARGHHADVGGTAPGSMTPLATTVDEEGVLIDNFKLLDRGRFRETELVELLTRHPYPVRNVIQNVADLKAQIAANEKGVQELSKMVDQFGLDVVQAYMRHVQDNAEESVRRVITQLKDGSFTLPLDNGAQISVSVKVNVAERSAVIDFAGTSPQQMNNFNAPRAVCMAAVLYVFRTLVDDDIPLNAGCLKPLQVIIPQGSMLNPNPPASVVAGNVETSTCITNALFGALGVMAGSQPTMNNFTFGNAQYQYYETIAGGSGAGAVLDASGRAVRGFDGTSVVQTHMTNSRLTDPEILELRFPVLLEDFHIREGSGGKGRWHAGDGTRRTIRFLEKMECAILSSHRNRPPEGIEGGGDGEPGRTEVRRLDGAVETLKACDQTVLEAGEAVIVTTPTSGGFGVAS